MINNRYILHFLIGLAISLATILLVFEYRVAPIIPIVCNLYKTYDVYEENQLLPPIPEEVETPPVISSYSEPKPEPVEYDFEEEVEEILEDVLEEPLSQTYQREEEDSILICVVEGYPRPIGGMKRFYAFLKGNLKYPEKAKKHKVEGRVFIQFIVDTDGIMKDFKLVRGLGYGFDQEAIRVIQELAKEIKWHPATQRGISVPQKMTFPIRFKLS